jgi:hypothetical protein
MLHIFGDVENLVDGVRSDSEAPLELLVTEDHEIYLRCFNEGGYSHTNVNVRDLLLWLRLYRPELLLEE